MIFNSYYNWTKKRKKKKSPDFYTWLKYVTKKHRRKFFNPFYFFFWFLIFELAEFFWLNPLVNHCHFDYITKLTSPQNKNTCHGVCVCVWWGVVGAMVVQEYLLLYTLCQMVCMFWWWLCFGAYICHLREGFLKRAFRVGQNSLFLACSLSLSVSLGALWIMNH